MGVKITGLDKMQKQLKEVERATEALNGSYDVVDTYLWIFKHFMEGKVLTRSLACLVYIKPYSDRTDSVTFQSVAKRSKVFLDKLQEPTSEMINKRGNIWCWKS